jgi:hypothetical protein
MRFLGVELKAWSCRDVGMVYVIDEGGVFDMPIDKIWEYLRSEEHRHPSVKMLGREMEGNSVVLTSERNVMGKTVQVKLRNTLYPPFGMVQEYLEGPLAGSKAFQFYVPKGNQTGVTVVGDFVIAGLDERATREAVLAQGEVFFNEDNANMKDKDLVRTLHPRS